MSQKSRMLKLSRDRCRGTSFVLVPTDNVSEKHRILAMAKPLINNENNPETLVLSRSNNQEYIWRKKERGTHPHKR